MQRLFFVSTGRCGTKRIAEILKEYLPSEVFSIQHQMDVSRISNIVGNIMYYSGQWEWIKTILYHHILKKYEGQKKLICSDPLISMMLPKEAIEDPDTTIIYLIRDKEEFAESFFRFSRKRFQSFLAHNFIPFWQIGIWPLENILNPRIKEKYKLLWKKKNNWLTQYYQLKPVNMKNIFKENYLSSIIQKTFHNKINIPGHSLQLKSNQTYG